MQRTVEIPLFHWDRFDDKYGTPEWRQNIRSDFGINRVECFSDSTYRLHVRLHFDTPQQALLYRLKY